jgi:hypothetical protein
MDELIPISELANQMGMDTGNARKYARKHGFQFVRARAQTPVGHQVVIALPKSQALRLLKFRQDQGFPLRGEKESVRPIKI